MVCPSLNIGQGTGFVQSLQTPKQINVSRKTSRCRNIGVKYIKVLIS
jgi:hypothetical protein